jgi:hypothetical protein
VLAASIIRVITLMEAARTSEISANFYQTTRCNIPEDSHFHALCRENLKFQNRDLFLFDHLKIEIEAISKRL